MRLLAGANAVAAGTNCANVSHSAQAVSDDSFGGHIQSAEKNLSEASRAYATLSTGRVWLIAAAAWFDGRSEQVHRPMKES